MRNKARLFVRCTVYRDANGTESTLTKINAEVDPVFTPPASPHGSDEEDDGVNLEDEGTKAQRTAGTTPAASPFPARPPRLARGNSVG